MFALENEWIWDFWLVEDSGAYHMYFLHAPKSLGKPELRHRSARIGHAISTDLVNWEYVGVALVPGEPGEWDDFVTWTGCVTRIGSLWHMYYTGTGSPLGHEVQRIGLATSADLMTWTKHPANPVLDLAGPWYERFHPDLWHNQAWRDPWVYRCPDDTLRMLITARSADGKRDERGVVGLALSEDGVRWTAQAPIAAPRIAGDLEVPQMLNLGEHWYIVFCTARWSSGLSARGISGCSTAYLKGVAPDGPFEWADTQVLTSPTEGLFGARIITRRDRHYVLGWQRETKDGEFGGWVTDPLEIAIDASGQIVRTSDEPVRTTGRHSPRVVTGQVI